MNSQTVTTPSLRRALEAPFGTEPALRLWSGGEYRAVTREEWVAHAIRVARGLRLHGVEPGDRVAAILTNTLEGCALAPACWWSGSSLVSLPVPARGQALQAYLGGILRALRDARPVLLLVESRFGSLLGGVDFGVPVVPFEELPAGGDPELQPLDPEAEAFVQYSSGSTAAPKGCVLTQGAIDVHLGNMRELHATTGITGCSWLPLSHDMGLFGGLMPALTNGTAMLIGTPERFVRAPRTWFEDLVESAADFTVAPNFALALLIRAAAAGLPPGRASVQRIVCGGERVQWQTIIDLERAFGARGIDRGTVAPAYGLAEATLCLTHTPLPEPAHALHVDPAALAAGEVRECVPGDERAQAIVSCGVPVGGTEVLIEGEKPVGRVIARTPSRASGYIGAPDGVAAATFSGEWLRTGDFGFLHDGELYVLGRLDDVIVLGGRNVNARDVEERANTVSGVRAGTAVLVDEPGSDTSRLVLLAESTLDTSAWPALARTLSEVTWQSVGARLDRCLFLDRGAVPKTPSGKVARMRARELLADPGAALLAEVRPR